MRIALVLQQLQPGEFVVRVCVCGEVVAPYRHRTPQTVSADRLRLRAAEALTVSGPGCFLSPVFDDAAQLLKQ